MAVSHLSHVIASWTERLRADPFVNSAQHFGIEVVAVVDLAQVPHEIVQLHPLLRL
jgi:hypothetical protein